MVASTQILEVPYHAKLVDENGEISRPWMDFFSLIVRRIEQAETTLASDGLILDDLVITTASLGVTTASLGVDRALLETAASSMEDLTGVATATGISSAWETFRTAMLDI